MKNRNRHEFSFFNRSIYLMLFLCLSLSFSSCSIFRGGNKSDVQAHNEMVKRQNDAIDEEVKKYDKMYHEQTDRQDKQQRKMIKKSRKKPKHMRRHEREFFLWRWLGI